MTCSRFTSKKTGEEKKVLGHRPNKPSHELTVAEAGDKYLELITLFCPLV